MELRLELVACLLEEEVLVVVGWKVELEEALNLFVAWKQVALEEGEQQHDLWSSWHEKKMKMMKKELNS